MNIEYLIELFKIVVVIICVFFIAKISIHHLINKEPLIRIPFWYTIVLIAGSLVGIIFIVMMIPEYLIKQQINFWDKFIIVLVPSTIGITFSLYRHYKITAKY